MLRSKGRMKTFYKIILIINVIFSFALMISYLAPYADPRNFSLIAIFGFFYQLLILLNLFFVFFWLFIRRAFSLLSLVAVLIGTPILLQNFKFRFPGKLNDKKELSDKIRIMAYNVHGFIGIDKLNNQPIEQYVFQLINDKQPDVLTFEEFDARKADKGATAGAIKKLMQTNSYYFKANSYRYRRFQKGNDSSGTAIFSKYPIIDTGTVPAPSALKIRSIFADINFKGKIIRIYCIHLAAVALKESDKRKYLSGDINFGKSSEISSSLNLAFIRRSYQVEKIKDHMSQCAYPMIIAGDFNDTPISYAVNTLSDGLKNAFIEKGSGLGTTYYSIFPKLHIDYILVSPQFDVLSYQTIDKKLSDHMPIISDLKFNQ